MQKYIQSPRVKMTVLNVTLNYQEQVMLEHRKYNSQQEKRYNLDLYGHIK